MGPRQVADLVEKEGAPIGSTHETHPLSVRSRKGAFGVPE